MLSGLHWRPDDRSADGVPDTICKVFLILENTADARQHHYIGAHTFFSRDSILTLFHAVATAILIDFLGLLLSQIDVPHGLSPLQQNLSLFHSRSKLNAVKWRSQNCWCDFDSSPTPRHSIMENVLQFRVIFLPRLVYPSIERFIRFVFASMLILIVFPNVKVVMVYKSLHDRPSIWCDLFNWSRLLSHVNWIFWLLEQEWSGKYT